MSIARNSQIFRVPTTYLYPLPPKKFSSETLLQRNQIYVQKRIKI